MDVAGFARVGNFDTAAERQHQSIHAQIGGAAFQPAFCNASQGTNIHSDTEILEGAGGNDILSGFDGNHDEIFWGREGDDVIMGYGGNDTIEGLSGNDELHGGPGRDRLRGGDGNDTLYAADGEADIELSVSGSGCVHDRDPSDPQGARMCN
jgi:Ca2+-binding RTX toxin-like protein